MTSMRPIQDAVEEVQVQTGSTSAEYGSYLGVHVNVVTKSGTNQFHGSAYEYCRSDALNERGYFENRALPKNPLRRDQYGVVMNGPVVLPGYDGHNRTFFMGAYEGIDQEGSTTPFASVPTEKMRRGDFSEISAQIRDPYTRQPFAGNQIPLSRLDPVSAKLLQYYPLPNLPGTANNYQGPAQDDDYHDQFIARVDQNISNNVRLSFRYNWMDSDETFSPANIEINPAWQPRVNQNWLGSYTHTLRSNLHNDFRIGYHQIDFDTVNFFYYTGVEGAGAALGVPGFDGDVKYNNPGIPAIGVSNFATLNPSGTNRRPRRASRRRAWAPAPGCPCGCRSAARRAPGTRRGYGPRLQAGTARGPRALQAPPTTKQCVAAIASDPSSCRRPASSWRSRDRADVPPWLPRCQRRREPPPGARTPPANRHGAPASSGGALRLARGGVGPVAASERIGAHHRVEQDVDAVGHVLRLRSCQPDRART
jgi:hypothetical protein